MRLQRKGNIFLDAAHQTLLRSSHSLRSILAERISSDPTTTTSCTAHRAPRTAHRVSVFPVLAVVLLFAAALKSEALFHAPTVTVTVLLHLALIAYEVALASWLLRGCHERFALPVAMATFAAFATYSLSEIAAGERYCGCFGRVVVSPGVSFAVDLAAVVLLAVRRANERREVVWGCAAVGALFGGVVATRPFPQALFPVSGTAAENTVTLDLPSTIGTKLPILAQIREVSELEYGECDLLIVHDGCSACASAVANFLTGAGEKSKAILVLDHAGSTASGANIDVSDRCRVLSLVPGARVEVRTPVRVNLVGGYVVAFGQ